MHEKLTSELASLTHAMGVDAERLQAHRRDLLAGEPAVRDEMARLEVVRDLCRHVAGRVKMTVEQAERSVGELRRKGDPEVDELVCSTTIVYNQYASLPLHLATGTVILIAEHLVLGLLIWSPRITRSKIRYITSTAR